MHTGWDKGMDSCPKGGFVNIAFIQNKPYKNESVTHDR